MSRQRAAFLDLNGTLVMPVSADAPEDFTELPGAREAVRRLVLAGYVCPVVTVQSRIAKGTYTQTQFLDWFEGFAAIWRSAGAPLLGPYICPHRFNSGCVCAKPQPTLYQIACKDLGLNPQASFVIGDSASDIFAARNIGARGCLVLTGNGIRECPACSDAAFMIGDSIADLVPRLLAV